MTYNTFILEADGLTEIGIYNSVAEAIDDTRSMWMEDSNPEELILVMPEGRMHIEATLERAAHDPEICVTTYAGVVEVHRCTYILDADGRYERTEVTRWYDLPASFAV